MPLKLSKHQYKGLQTTVLESSSAATIPVILCHGYGASGDDLVSLAEPISDWLEDASDQFRFVFPAAPLSPPDLAPYGGRAWWEINMAKLLAASQSGRFDELHDIEPPGVNAATQQLADCVKAILADTKEASRYVLGGFSQGAMVTMNAVLQTDIPAPELLVQFSGTMICRPQWQAAMTDGRLRQTCVLQSHGRQDFVLPFSSAEVLHNLLFTENVRTQFIPFDGPHTIPMEALMQLAVELKRMAGNGG